MCYFNKACKNYDAPVCDQLDDENPCFVVNDILVERLKSQLGIDGERKGVEFCTIYDDEWPDIIKHILICNT